MLLRQLDRQAEAENHLPYIDINEVGDVCCAQIIGGLLFCVPQHHGRKRLVQLSAEPCQGAMPCRVQDGLREFDGLLAELGDEVQKDDMNFGRYGLAIQKADQ
jgi:hypothetical protein